MMQQFSPPDANADDRIDAFVYLMNHELKTPLTALKAYVELANRRAHKLDAQLSDAQVAQKEDVSESFDPLLLLLERAENQANRLTQLVGDLVEAYTFRTEHLVIHTERCNLSDIVEACITEQQQGWPTRTIHLDAATRPVWVVGDAARLRQVINHYLHYAFMHAPAEEAVTMQISREGATVRVSVIDRGLDLSSTTQVTLWDLTQPRAIDLDEGNSLEMGLFLSKQIIELHGGTVGVTSAAGEGTPMWFTLPACQID